MKITSVKTNDALKNEVLQILNESEDKNEAVFEAIDRIVTAQNQELINEIVMEAATGRKNGFRQLTDTETAFYQRLMTDPKQAVTADQINIIPTETIDYTLNEVKSPSGIRSLINFAPAGVKKWLTASKTGVAKWGNLTDAITTELSATIAAMNMDVYKLSVLCYIPKAIRDLEIGYVDKYFTAILNEAMEDGIEAGFLDGDGKEAPIGIMRKIDEVNTDGTHKAKTKLTTVTKLSPKGLAPVLKTLSHNGTRVINRLILLCNPSDKYEYVNPAMYGENPTGGWTDKSFVNMEVIETTNLAAGTGVFTIPGAYTMGFQGVNIDEYKETKAVEDCDTLIAKVYGNGRATDDDTAVPFDITKLVEFVPTYKSSAA